MSSWLDRLDRRFGRHLPPNLTLFLVASQGLSSVLDRVSPGFLDYLKLDAAKVAQGQLWRLVTFVAVPTTSNAFFLILSLLWTYMMGTFLEQHWGGVRYVAYWLLGMAGTAALAVGLGVPATSRYLLMSLLLAVATLDPEREVMLLVIPMRLKWLAYLEVALLVWEAATLPGGAKVFPVVAVGNYLVFFGPTLVQAVRTRQRKATHVVEAHRAAQAPAVTQQRRCATCGVTDDDRSVEFRVCTCERCGKPTNFCLPHVREHLAAAAPAEPS
jgi:membrane associated rhomboid family serine protease